MVQTLAKTFFALGYVAVRMNFRGVGASDGVHDEGAAKREDWLAVAQAMRARYGELAAAAGRLLFGAFVQTRVAKRLS